MKKASKTAEVEHTEAAGDDAETVFEVDLSKPGKEGGAIAAALAAIMGGPKAHEPKVYTREQAEETIARLKSEVSRYLTRNALAPGDVVTVRDGVGKKGHGWPMVVVETYPDAPPLFDANVSGGPKEGTRVTTRVLFIHPRDGELASWCFHHSELEPYVYPEVAPATEPEIEGAAV